MKKVPEHCSGLCPSEKELPEQRSITKIPLGVGIRLNKKELWLHNQLIN
jgi:hypothetical protein